MREGDNAKWMINVQTQKLVSSWNELVRRTSKARKYHKRISRSRSAHNHLLLWRVTAHCECLKRVQKTLARTWCACEHVRTRTVRVTPSSARLQCVNRAPRDHMTLERVEWCQWPSWHVCVNVDWRTFALRLYGGNDDKTVNRVSDEMIELFDVPEWCRYKV